jgi:hypothetical protein
MWKNCTKNINEWLEQLNSLTVGKGEKKWIHNMNRMRGYTTLFIQI